MNISCRGAIDNTLTLTSEVRDSTLAIGNFFFFFVKPHFHFWTDLKYTVRLIAGSLSAFISKIQKLIT